MIEIRNKIVLGEGTDQEKTIYLSKPKGRKAREMMPKVLAFMSELSKNQSSGKKNTMDEVSKTISQFWSKTEFESELLPFVLQLDTIDGRTYLEENCTIGEILQSFTKAAQYLIEESFQREEVQDALGKSQDEAQEAQKV